MTDMPSKPRFWQAARLAFLVIVLIVQGAVLYRQVRIQNSLAGLSTASAPVRDAGNNVRIDVSAMPRLGGASATVALIELSDFQCPYCARHATEVYDLLIEQYVETGQVAYFVGNNPLPSHPLAPLLASAAICAGEQGRYWEMHAGLFEGIPESEEEIMSIVGTLGLDPEGVAGCMSEPETSARIERDQQLAASLGLTSTPSFVLGEIFPGGLVEARRVIVGAQAVDVFRGAIEDELRAMDQRD